MPSALCRALAGLHMGTQGAFACGGRMAVVTLRRLQGLRDLIRDAETQAAILRSGGAINATAARKLARTLDECATEIRHALPWLAREAA